MRPRGPLSVPLLDQSVRRWRPAFLLAAKAADFPAANFPARTKNVGTNWVDYTLDYDKDTVETAYWEVTIPTGVVFTGATLDVYFRQAAATTNAVVFAARTLTRAEGEAWDTAGNTDAFAAETVPGTAGQVGVVSKALTVTGWAAGEVLMVALDRTATDAGDTLAEDCKVMYAVLRLT